MRYQMAAIVGIGSVLDTLGGSIRTKSFSVLKKGGCLISGIAPADTSGEAERLGVRNESFFMWPSGEQLAQIAALVESGVIKPVVDRSFSLDEVQQALDYSQSGRAKGKIAIKVK
jgi:NADPH:quinone reductase-like Zn-dependent oxidoreductase